MKVLRHGSYRPLYRVGLQGDRINRHTQKDRARRARVADAMPRLPSDDVHVNVVGNHVVDLAVALGTLCRHRAVILPESTIPNGRNGSQLQLFASIAVRHFSTRASILGADASTVASSKPCPSITMRNSQPSGWLRTSQTAEIAWSPFGLVRRKPWGRRTGRQRQLGAFDIIRAELGICPLRDVSALAGCARLAIHWSSSRLLIRSGSRCSKAHASALLSTRTREREIYWVGVRLFGEERFSSQSRGVRGDLVPGQPCAGSGTALVRI